MYQRLQTGDHRDPVVMQPQLTQSTAVVQPFHHRDPVGEQPQPVERWASEMLGKAPKSRGVRSLDMLQCRGRIPDHAKILVAQKSGEGGQGLGTT